MLIHFRERKVLKLTFMAFIQVQATLGAVFIGHTVR